MTEQENREAFEETLSRIGKTDESTFDKHDDGSYKMDIIHFGWKMWQASANREGYKLVPLEPSEEMYSDLSRHLCRYMQMKDRYCPKTLGEYIKRYIGFKNIPQWLHDEVRDWESTHAFATADMGVFIYKAMINAV